MANNFVYKISEWDYVRENFYLSQIFIPCIWLIILLYGNINVGSNGMTAGPWWDTNNHDNNWAIN